MVSWKGFLLKPEPKPKVALTTGRVEIQRNGEVAYLEYSLSGNLLTLIHTEVPENLRGLGLSSALAESALTCARKSNFRVDVICPIVQGFIEKHPEYSDIVIH